MKTVTAAVLMDNGKVFIAQRGTEDPLPNKWEFPGGKMEEGETPQQCLKREKKEAFAFKVGEHVGEMEDL